jgi:hypothetical protein
MNESLLLDFKKYGGWIEVDIHSLKNISSKVIKLTKNSQGVVIKVSLINGKKKEMRNV